MAMHLIGGWRRRFFSDPQLVVLALLLLLLLLAVVATGRMLAPVFVSIVVAYLLDGAVSFVQGRMLSRKVSVILVFGLFIAVLAVLIIGVLPLIALQIGELASQLPDMLARGVKLVLELPKHYPSLVTTDQMDILTDSLRSSALSYGHTLLSWSVKGVADVIGILVYLVLVPMLVFFFLKDKELILDWIRQRLSPHGGVATAVWHDVDKQISNYVRGKAWEVLIAWASYGVVFYAFGLNYALLLSLLVGLSVVIPYIGAVLVTVPVMLVASFQWGWSTQLAWLIPVYFLLHTLDGNLLVPLLFSEVVDLHPVAIVVAILVFGGIWGFWGVFFAIPLATLVQAVLTAWMRRTEEAA